jgi:hypothetical protein
LRTFLRINGIETKKRKRNPATGKDGLFAQNLSFSFFPPEKNLSILFSRRRLTKIPF